MNRRCFLGYGSGFLLALSGCTTPTASPSLLGEWECPDYSKSGARPENATLILLFRPDGNLVSSVFTEDGKLFHTDTEPYYIRDGRLVLPDQQPPEDQKRGVPMRLTGDTLYLTVPGNGQPDPTLVFHRKK